MNSAQKLNALMNRAEDAAADLIKVARDVDVSKPWTVRDLLSRSRQYADAMRAIRNEHRNERRRARKAAA